MKKLRIAMVLTAVAAAGMTVSTAHAAFSGKVCNLLTSKQVAAVHVSPLKCTPQKSFGSAYSTNYSGTWGAIRGLGPHLTVVVVLYKNTTYFQAAKNNLKLGYTKKVSGIGSAAYESYGGVLAQMSFVVGRYIATLNLRTSKSLKSVAAFNALAKVIAKQL